MFPYRDENPTQHFPFFTLALIAVNVYIWVTFQQMGFVDQVMANALCNWGLIPGELTGMSIGSSIPITNGFLCIVDPEPELLTLITMQFLHGGWLHLIGNMLFLWVFGNNIEDATGHFRFLTFYLLCGIAGGIAQLLVDPASPIPMVGASGAISGVLGAYLLLYPRARVWMVLPIFFYPLRFSMPAWFYLIYWFLLQLVSGVVEHLETPPGQTQGGVAFWAHAGGFLAGMLLLRLFRRPGHRVRQAVSW